MKKIIIDRAHVYSVGWCASLMILDVIYDIEDKVRIAYVVDDTIIGYKYVNLGKMMENIKKGLEPLEAIEKASGQYGRFDEAVKKIDPRKE